MVGRGSGGADVRGIASMPPLSPVGTARQRVDPTPADRALAEMATRLREADQPEGLLALAWDAARWADGLEPADRSELAGILLGCLMAVETGSTRVSLGERARALAARAPSVVGRTLADHRPFVLEGRHLYPQRLLDAEERLGAAIRMRRARPSPFAAAPIATAVDEVARSGARPLDPDQRAAVEAALGRSLAVVTGGPGTGKTSIVVAIVRAAARLGLGVDRIALSAPTGKAANRLAEQIRSELERIEQPSAEDRALAAGGPSPQTLHRLLGWSPGAAAFRHHARSPLPHALVVVDEASMIDLPLMAQLFGALAPEASLVLIGDGDQLPSVEAGSVFRDLGALAVTLGTSYRMAPAAAAARMRGEGVEMVPSAGREAMLASFAERHGASGGRAAELARATYAFGPGGFSPADAAAVAEAQSHVGRARVLCVTRGRPTGAEAVNAWIHRRLGGAPGLPMAGEPVMVLRNDYDRSLWNGDQGVVLRVRGTERVADGGGAGRLCAVFPARAGWAVFDLAGLGDSIGICHAMTVHKAQGSEFDEVAFILPDQPIPLLSREVVYTALTRSRRSAVICGAPDVLGAGIANPAVRDTGIAEKLAATGP